MTVELKPLSEVTDEALRLLSRELGVADTLRFLGQFTTGHGNYTEERRQIFGDPSLDALLSEMDRAKKQTEP